MQVVQDFLAILGVVLELTLVVFLLRGPWKKFVALFAYILADLGSTLAETFAASLYNIPGASAGSLPPEGQRLYTHLYWLDEVTLDLILFLVVISITYKVFRGRPARKSAQRLLTGVVLLVIALPFLAYHPNFTPWPDGRWFNSTSQLLNFGAAIMNLVLWTGLLAVSERDPQLIMVSIGLGVEVSGAAMSFGLLHLMQSKAIPEILLLVTHFIGLLVWCWAFRPVPKTSRPRAPVISIERMR